MTMAYKCDFKLQLRPTAVGEAKQKLAVAWKQAHQECVGEAKKRSPHDTGNNMRSINPGGVVNESGAIDVDPNNIVVDVHTTSGYGGYLEAGTRQTAGRPYVLPAVEQVMGPGGAGAKILEGCI
jgi:hypothetical protein